LPNREGTPLGPLARMDRRVPPTVWAIPCQGPAEQGTTPDGEFGWGGTSVKV